MELKTIATFFNQGDAALLRSQLDAAGFHPFVKGENSALTFESSVMSTGGIDVQVPEDEIDSVREFLNADTADGSEDKP